MRLPFLAVMALAFALGQARAEPAPTSAPVLAAGEEVGLKPKDIFRDCRDCPDMVVIPAGKFLMGSKEQKPGDAGNEGPQHEVVLRQALRRGPLQRHLRGMGQMRGRGRLRL